MSSGENIHTDTLAPPEGQRVTSDDTARVESGIVEKDEPHPQTRSWRLPCALVGLLILIAISMLPFFLIGASLRRNPI